MASLSDTLRQRRDGQTKRGPGGQLTQETPEEIQSLAGQAGLQAPPTSPMEAGVLGANKDQQKMMGTPAQKQAAFSLASAPQNQGLAATLRTQQARTEKTGEEQQQQQKTQDMQNLGSLGDRVTGFIDAQRQKLAAQAQAVTPQNSLQVNTQDQFQGKDITGIKGLLEQYRADPQNQGLLLQINKAMGYDINTQLDPSQVDQLYESANDTISRGGAQNVDDALKVSDLLGQQDFGYTPEQLSQLLGVPASTIQGMSVDQLRSEIDRVGSEEMSNSQEMLDKSQSGQLGQAERGLAQQSGRDLSATGVRATEADYQGMEQQIQNADKVTFGGKEYQVDQLLQDDTISGIIKEYLESAPGSPIRNQLEKSEPQLLEFINKNQAVLQDATSQMQAGAGTFKETQEYNKGLTNIEGQELAPELAAALIPGFGELQAEKVDTSQVPFFQALNAMPSSGRRQQAVNALNTAVDTYPDVPQQLSGLSADEISKLNIGKSGGFFDTWMSARQQRDAIAAINPADTNSLVSTAFNGENANSFGRKQEQARLLGAFGQPTGLSMDISNTNGLKDKMLAATPEVSLKDATTGNIPSYQKQTLGDIQFPKDPTKANWIQLASPYAADGVIDKDEVNAITATVPKQQPGVAVQQLIALEDMANSPGAKIDKAAVTAARQQMTDANTSQQIQMKSTSGNPNTQIDNYLGLLADANKDGRTLNPSTVNSAIDAMMQSEIGSEYKFRSDFVGNMQKAISAGAKLSENTLGQLDKWLTDNGRFYANYGLLKGIDTLYANLGRKLPI